MIDVRKWWRGWIGRRRVNVWERDQMVRKLATAHKALDQIELRLMTEMERASTDQHMLIDANHSLKEDNDRLREMVARSQHPTSISESEWPGWPAEWWPGSDASRPPDVDLHIGGIVGGCIVNNTIDPDRTLRNPMYPPPKSVPSMKPWDGNTDGDGK